jgi:hypothetical protein
VAAASSFSLRRAALVLVGIVRDACPARACAEGTTASLAPRRRTKLLPHRGPRAGYAFCPSCREPPSRSSASPGGGHTLRAARPGVPFGGNSPSSSRTRLQSPTCAAWRPSSWSAAALSSADRCATSSLAAIGANAAAGRRGRRRCPAAVVPAGRPDPCRRGSP